MANSLSQYLNDINRARNDEMAQMLSAALPFMQYEIERDRMKQLYDEQLGRYRTDLSMQIKDESLRNEFLNTGYSTMEGVQMGFGNIMDKQKYRQYSDTIRNSYAPIVGQENMSVIENAINTSQSKEELDTQLKVALSGMPETEAAVKPRAQALLNPEYYTRYEELVKDGNPPASALVQAKQEMDRATDQQQLADRARYNRSYSGGGTTRQTQEQVQTGAASMQVNNNYRAQRDKVLVNNDGGTYVAKLIGEKVYLVPARVGTDERLYVIGEQGEYAANPHDYIEAPRRGNLQVVPRSKVDEWNRNGRQINRNIVPGEDEGAVIGIDINGNPIRGRSR